jgi:DNA-binding transcriptional LysR family regulator
MGIGLLPDFSCAELLSVGKLRALLPDWRPVGFFRQQIYAIRPFLGTKTPRAVQCLVEKLTTQLAKSFS